MAKQTIGLCMIVRNEAQVIRRCLASVRPLLDHWLIVDTGSTDGTQDLVREAMRELPGRLVERPWRDFAQNRSEALTLARPHGDYSLIIDADDELVVPPGYSPPPLEADSYVLDIDDSGTTNHPAQLVSNALPWRYEGVLHEYLVCEAARATGYLPLMMRRNHDGARRRDPQTYARDAAVLERALADTRDPFTIARYTFYLAQSYRDCGQREKALDRYLARANLGFWDQEVFVSLYQAGKLMEALGRSSDEIVRTYRRASEACPIRAEAAHAASRHLRLADEFAAGYAIAKPALDLAQPAGGLFVEPWIYEYGLRDEFAVNAYWSGHYRDCADAALKALESGKVPPAEQPRFLRNARFGLDMSARTQAPPAAGRRAPGSPKGGTELMVDALRDRLSGALEAIDLRVNLYDPATRDARPLVVWIHHDIDQAAVQWCRDPASTGPVARFVFISHWQRERFVQTFGLAPERCVVIKHAMEQTTDMRRWQPGSVIRCAYTSTPFRGLDVLLDAWEELAPASAELHVWSSMTLYAQDDAPYRPLFERAQAMPGVIYHGLAPNDALRAALRTIDFLTYPSTFAETACLSVMEAMAAGCRVIVPAYGALPETTGGYARTYPWCADKRKHASAFRDALAAEMAEPWMGRPDLSLAQQAHCAATFDWSSRLAEWRRLIASLAPGDASSGVPRRRGTDGEAAANGDARRAAAAEPLAAHLARLRDGGFAPRGILDVGAHDGAFARVARTIFPEAHILMVDALAEKEQVLADVAREIGHASHAIALLGDRDLDSASFFVVDTQRRPDLVKTGSSLFVENTSFPKVECAMPQRRLDGLVARQGGTFDFLKLDVQGAELAVLAGLGDHLADVSVIMLEMSLVEYNEGAPLIGDVFAELSSRGFVLHEIVEQHRYRDGRLLQLDGLFVRAASSLRPRPPFW